MVACTPHAVTTDWHCTDRVSINVLPDDVLLHVFHWYRIDTMDHVNETWGWHKLMHTCRRWRSVVLGFPHFLDLRLLCTERTPVRDTLDVWPPFPVIIEYRHSPIARSQSPVQELEDCDGPGSDLIAALGDPRRIHRITVCGLTDSLLRTVGSAVLEPFPALTYLRLESGGDPDSAPALPDGFLGGIAPRLQKIWLEGIQFPQMPIILQSARDLVDLRLDKIPDSWHISPQMLATALEPLTKLVSLSIEFQPPQSRPDQTTPDPPPLKRVVLPALAVLFFKGVSEYFEDLVSRMDAPRLTYAFVKFFNQLIFDMWHLPTFITRTEKLNLLNRAELFFDALGVGIGLYLPGDRVPRNLTLRILCSHSDWQLSSLAQVCNQSSSLLSRVERLDIRECSSWSREPQWQDKAQWVDLFNPFTAVKALHVPRELGVRIAPVLKELTKPRAAAVLPALNSLVFEEFREFESSKSLQEAIQQFVAARASTGRPVEVCRWEGKWERDVLWEWDLAREWARDLKL
jgi:hypothetical protein